MKESELRAILGLSPDRPLTVIPGAEFGNTTEERAENMSKLQKISVSIPVAFNTVEILRAERGEYTYVACVDPYPTGQVLWDGCMQAVIRMRSDGHPGEVTVCCEYCDDVKALADSVHEHLEQRANREGTIDDLLAMLKARDASAAVLVQERGTVSVEPLSSTSALCRDDMVVVSVHGGDAAVDYARYHAATVMNETWIVGRARTEDVGEDLRPWAMDDAVSGVIWNNVEDDGSSSPETSIELTSAL